jgi:hypothetical protein
LDAASSSNSDNHTNANANNNDWDDDDNVAPEFETALEEMDGISPQPISSVAPLRQSNRSRKPNPRYDYNIQQHDWTNSTADENMELCIACASEAIPPCPIKGGDIQSWEPAPRTIRDIIKKPEGQVRNEWLKSVKKVIKALVDAKTFIKDTMLPGEKSTPVKIQSDDLWTS